MRWTATGGTPKRTSTIATVIGTPCRRLDDHWQDSQVRPPRLASLTAALLLWAAAPAAADQGTVVSRMGDSKIVEASGLAVSATTPDLAYTLNDSNNKPVVYAI